MTKEMYVSSTPHETKVGLVEDDQLAEIFFERENEYTLAGSIYKGRVTRVLPGMQSAFVDVGLERDAFLYVSDFLEVPEDEENEFDEIAVSRPETFVSNRPPQAPRFEFKAEPVPPGGEPAAMEEEEGEEEAVTEGNTQEFAEVEGGEESTGDQDRFRGNRRRRRGRRGRGFPETKYARPAGERPEPREEHEAPRRDSREEREAPRRDFGPPADYQPIILPGESLSKYRGQRPAATQPPERAVPTSERPVPTSAAQPTFVIESEEFGAEGDVHEHGVEAAVDQPQQVSDVREVEPEVPAVREIRRVIPRPEPRQVEPRPVESRGYQEHPPIVLPGESIAKYQPREAAPPRSTDVAASAEDSSHVEPATEPPAEVQSIAAETPAPRIERREPESRFRPSSERSPQDYLPRSADFSVLPGESIAKYRNPAHAKTEEMAREQAEHAAESEEHFVEEAAGFVAETEPLAESLQDVEPAAEPMVLAESEETTTAAETSAAEAYADQEVASREVAPVEGEDEAEPEAKDEERFEQMNVAAVFGGAAAEPGEPSEVDEPTLESLEPAAPGAPAIEEAVGEVQVPGGARDERIFGRAGAGSTLEHEEIEGDEEESHFHPPTDEESDADYIELEEETLDADNFARVVAQAAVNADLPEAEQLTDAIEESDTERAAMSDAYETEEEGEIDDTEFEEEELVGEEALPEGQQEEAIGRAEVRGPSAKAGYQRTVERPFDRRDRDRGRRGGRGGGRGRIVRRHEQPREHVQISDLLKEGQEVLVQIAKEPIGKKGARITSHIALPGRFLVYMPTVNHVGVSRKITSDDERQRLKRIMISEREGGHGGFIVRTAAAGVGEDELRADIRFLKNLWAQIKQRAENGKAPALIYHDLNLVERILRDQVTSDFSQIWVDTEGEYERILNFANRFQPSLVRRVKLYTRDTPLFEQFGIQEEINKALKAKVWLKSGGYIVINQTEALVAIDINTGKYVGKTARLEDTIVKTNIDAIREIVRQIRLRDLGGIIVIDFIDMDERKNRQKVMLALEDALKADRSPSKVLAFNDFGLVAITRKRVKQSLERTLGAACPYCTGNGFVKSVTTICNEIFVELRKMARQLDADIVNLRVNPEIAKALKAEKGKWLTDFEELTGRTVLVKPDALLHQEQFDIHG